MAPRPSAVLITAILIKIPSPPLGEKTNGGEGEKRSLCPVAPRGRRPARHFLTILRFRLPQLPPDETANSGVLPAGERNSVVLVVLSNYCLLSNNKWVVSNPTLV